MRREERFSLTPFFNKVVEKDLKPDLIKESIKKPLAYTEIKAINKHNTSGWQKGTLGISGRGSEIVYKSLGDKPVIISLSLLGEIKSADQTFIVQVREDYITQVQQLITDNFLMQDRECNCFKMPMVNMCMGNWPKFLRDLEGIDLNVTCIREDVIAQYEANEKAENLLVEQVGEAFNLLFGKKCILSCIVSNSIIEIGVPLSADEQVDDIAGILVSKGISIRPPRVKDGKDGVRYAYMDFSSNLLEIYDKLKPAPSGPIICPS